MPPLEVPSRRVARMHSELWFDVGSLLRPRLAVTRLALQRGTRSNLLMAALLSGEHEIPESYDELMGVAS